MAYQGTRARRRAFFPVLLVWRIFEASIPPYISYWIYKNITFVLRFLLESPRWLLSRERNKEATQLIKRIAQTNGTTEKLEAYFNNGNVKIRSHSTENSSSFCNVVDLLYCFLLCRMKETIPKTTSTHQIKENWIKGGKVRFTYWRRTPSWENVP